MSNRPFCWICAGEFAEPWPRSGDLFSIDCTTCGKYQISASLLASEFRMPEAERHRMSFWSKRRQLEGRDQPVLTEHTIGAIVAQVSNPPPHQKSDLLLVSLTLRNPVPGSYITVDDWRERSLACARDQGELNFCIRSLRERGDIGITPAGITITGAGWERAARLAAQPETSKTAFVAMRFSDDMLAVWKAAFYPAITRAGFEPRLANDPAHNERIDARIITELKQCRFLVADVTWGRAGVYFEAGYALGMGRPVIWTCRTDRHATDMHFDTRQYNHILWESAEELSEQLYYRIVATI